MKKKKAVKRSGARAASVAGRYLDMPLDELVRLIVYHDKITVAQKIARDIHTLAASVLSQKEKDGK